MMSVNNKDDNKEDVRYLFEKKFSFEKCCDWTLPDVTRLHEDNSWTVEILMKLKIKLNSIKSLLNDKGEHWQQHTADINKAGLVINFIKDRIQPEILTQAWCKFYEILSTYELVPNETKEFKSLHLCEAPGGFVSALNYYLCVNYPSLSWEWMANTLNPYYEGHNMKHVVVDDRLVFPTLKHWYFGQENTGDVTNPNYISDITNLEGSGQYSLVTADGSISCIDDPGEQELIVAELHFAEILIALCNLAEKGSLVIKKFTLFESITICQIYLLNCIFEKVHVFKPFTSKGGNSEVYVICLQYLGAENWKDYLFHLKKAYCSKTCRAIFPKSTIPVSFINQIVQCSKLFSELQSKAIRENLNLYSALKQVDPKSLNELQTKCAEIYLEKYKIFPDEMYKFRKLFSPKRRIITSFYDNKNRNLKSVYFQAIGETFENLSKSKAMLWLDVVLDIEKRINALFPPNKKRPFEELEWHCIWKEINNRMKSKSYKNFLVTGKKIDFIQNSKFCMPAILHLWNRVAHESQIKAPNHFLKSHCYWDISELTALLRDDIELTDYCIVYFSILSQHNCENDAIFLCMKQSLGDIKTCFLNVENQELSLLTEKKIIFVNTTSWSESLHQEIQIRHDLVNVLSKVIKVMNMGETLIICIQSLLTRYVVGIFFMLLSLFEKFMTILPSDAAPAASGQIWVFKHFRSPDWTNRLNHHLETILNCAVSEENEVLEVIPITALCGGSFYTYLLNINNSHLLQRLRSLIVTEKIRHNKGK